MKKLKLNLQSLNAEVLTRSQLKQILGGDDGSGDCPYLHVPCTTDQECKNVNKGKKCCSGCCYDTCTS